MSIDWGAVATHVVAFAAGLVLKTLMDFDVAHFLVKRFHWLPVRWLFRRRDPELSGTWEETWETQAESHQDPKHRHSHPAIRQLGPFIYAEHYAKGVKYKTFGRIRGSFVVGSWADAKDSHGYFGTFQLRIVDSSTMAGRWSGHSSATGTVNTGEWKWKKLNR